MRPSYLQAYPDQAIEAWLRASEEMSRALDIPE